MDSGWRLVKRILVELSSKRILLAAQGQYGKILNVVRSKLCLGEYFKFLQNDTWEFRGICCDITEDIIENGVREA